MTRRRTRRSHCDSALKPSLFKNPCSGIQPVPANGCQPRVSGVRWQTNRWRGPRRPVTGEGVEVDAAVAAGKVVPAHELHVRLFQDRGPKLSHIGHEHDRRVGRRVSGLRASGGRAAGWAGVGWAGAPGRNTCAPIIPFKICSRLVARPPARSLARPFARPPRPPAPPRSTALDRTRTSFGSVDCVVSRRYCGDTGKKSSMTTRRLVPLKCSLTRYLPAGLYLPCARNPAW